MSQDNRKRIKQFEVMVAERIRETHDTTTLILFTGNDHLDYKPGHFVTIDPHQFPALERWTNYLEDMKGKKETARAYSLYSAPHEKYLAITIKEEQYVSGSTKFPPLLSPVLVHRIDAGSKMVITGFTGPYVLPEDIESRTDHLVHVAAGSGVVPNMSMIKHALATDMKLSHTLIYSNKNWNDVIYRRRIEELQRQYPGKLKVVHALTRERNMEQFDGDVFAGRVNESLIRDLVPDASVAHFFVCGPGITKYDRQLAKEQGLDPAPRFLESVIAALQSIGVERSQLHHESYG
ncbi:MAG: oxidoreductase [Planctomycetota bacterium]|nr:oxidoreductase [Planctomycetota bacterium]